jgi:hypothetical protein
MFMQTFASAVLSMWVVGWMVTVGWLGASKVFMNEPVWWRLLQIVFAISVWPIMLGAGLHKALLPGETVDN